MLEGLERVGIAMLDLWSRAGILLWRNITMGMSADCNVV